MPRRRITNPIGNHHRLGQRTRRQRGIPPIGPYPFLVVPACQLVDEKLVQRWKNYAEQGGNLILTCRTGHKDRRGHLWEGLWAMPILDLIGAKIRFYDTLPAPNSGKVKAGKQTRDWVSWGEVLEPREGTTALASYTDQFYAGGVAAVTRKLGKGTVTYIGVDSQTGGLSNCFRNLAPCGYRFPNVAVRSSTAARRAAAWPGEGAASPATASFSKAVAMARRHNVKTTVILDFCMAIPHRPLH
jgi:hypothetical protein